MTTLWAQASKHVEKRRLEELLWELVELVSAFEGLAEAPVCRDGVGGEDLAAVASDCAEGQPLSHHALRASAILPNLAPVALHLEPPRPGAPNEHPLYVAGACHVVHQH